MQRVPGTKGSSDDGNRYTRRPGKSIVSFPSGAKGRRVLNCPDGAHYRRVYYANYYEVRLSCRIACGGKIYDVLLSAYYLLSSALELLIFPAHAGRASSICFIIIIIIVVVVVVIIRHNGSLKHDQNSCPPGSTLSISHAHAQLLHAAKVVVGFGTLVRA